MIEQKEFENGFQYLEVKNKTAEAKVALQGAHLFHYKKHGNEPLIWLSKDSHFTSNKAIRGGIPICWPWFGKHKSDVALPQHGFARTSLWELTETREDDESSSELIFRLKNSAKNLTLWPYTFELTLQISIADPLQLNLTTINTGVESFTLSSALHTYFAVSNIANVSVAGLDQNPYLDALTKQKEKQDGDIIINQETDRVYQNVHKPIELRDGQRIIHITGSGSHSAVVWNPWLAKSKRMSDMPDDAYKTMLCVETANALADERHLAPGERHCLGVNIL